MENCTALKENNEPIGKSLTISNAKKTSISPIKTPKRSVENSENNEPIRKRVRSHDDNARYAPTFVSPVLWTSDAGVSITALLVDKSDIIVATKDGMICWLNSDGKVTHRTHVECGVSRIIRDGTHLYAWGHSQAAYTKWKGALFEITTFIPRLMFEIEEFGEWLIHAEVNRDNVLIGDDKGNFALVGCYGDLIWKQFSDDGGSKTFLLDNSGVYVGHKKKITKYDLESGNQLWSYNVTGRFVTVQRAVQTSEHIFVDAAGQVHQLLKTTGDVVHVFAPLRHRAAGVCVKGNWLITGSCPTVLFNIETKEEVYHMNYAGRLGDSNMAMDGDNKLYITWDKVYCVDLSETSIKKAITGRSRGTEQLSMKTAQQQDQIRDKPELLVTAHERPIRGKLIVCKEETVKQEISEQQTDEDITSKEITKKRLVAKPLSSDCYSNWYVRFPQNLMKVNQKYVVEELVSNEKHKFYSIIGDIREYEDGPVNDQVPKEIPAGAEEPDTDDPRTTNTTDTTDTTDNADTTDINMSIS